MQRGNNNNNNRMLAHQACASCKHQRKRCPEDCALAPYFPAEKTQEFQAVLKVFGVSNVVKLVKDVDEERRKETADSLVWEALCRQNDPVLGCYGKFKKLQEEFELYKTQHPSPNQNPLGHQQGGGLYNEQPPLMVAWNGTNGINHRGNGFGGGLANNNMVNYGHDNAKLIVDSIPHNYQWDYGRSPDIPKQERVASCLLLSSPPLLSPPAQHPSVNGFNQQQYYLSDKTKQGRDASSLLLPSLPPLSHYHSVNEFSQQQYHLSGQFGSMNAQTMDNTLFMGEEDDHSSF